jgi:LPXTG-motif cell wall-anchored protein
VRTQKLVGALAVAAASVAGVILVAGGPAFADSVPAPAPTLVQGDNATTCADVNDSESVSLLLGDDQGSPSGPAGEGSVSGVDPQALTVDVNAGWTVVTIVVKGSNAYNIYNGPWVGPITITGLVAPVNASGGPAGISHWFVCGYQSGGEEETPTPSGSRTTTPTDPPVTTTTEPGLPVTGASITGIVLLGVALIGGGAALLVARRRREANETPTA